MMGYADNYVCSRLKCLPPTIVSAGLSALLAPVDQHAVEPVQLVGGVVVKLDPTDLAASGDADLGPNRAL
jgi:hypothetical protein